MTESWPTIGACINMDGSNRELNPHGTSDFPIACYYEEIRDGKGQYVPDHWHDDLEVLTLVEGECSIAVDGENGVLHAGDGIFFNRKSHHMLVGRPRCRIASAVFNPVLVAGTPDSVFAHRYVSPVIADDAPRFVVFHPDDRLHFADQVLRTVEAERAKQPGYEFAVRDALSRCMYSVWDAMGRPRGANLGNPIAEMGKLNLMCMFVKDHLAERFSVADIADAAGVSERECLRAFKRTLGVSPVRYVMLNRLSRAANLLACDERKSIAEIAAETGFSSGGYFSKLFRDEFGVSPRTYRIQMRDATFSPKAMMAGVPINMDEVPRGTRLGDPEVPGGAAPQGGADAGDAEAMASDGPAGRPGSDKHADSELIGSPYVPIKTVIGATGGAVPKIPDDALGSAWRPLGGAEETIG